MEYQNLKAWRKAMEYQSLKAWRDNAVNRMFFVEIHNHFEPGSNSQVFNDKVKGEFTKKKKAGKAGKGKKKWKKKGRRM